MTKGGPTHTGDRIWSLHIWLGWGEWPAAPHSLVLQALASIYPDIHWSLRDRLFLHFRAQLRCSTYHFLSRECFVCWFSTAMMITLRLCSSWGPLASYTRKAVLLEQWICFPAIKSEGHLKVAHLYSLWLMAQSAYRQSQLYSRQ